MGFMDKLKNIFFEEEEDEEEIEETRPPKKEKEKKEEKIAKKIEVTTIRKEEPKKEKMEEIVKQEPPKEEIKKEEPKRVKVNTELIFDDEDFIFDTKKEKEEPKKVVSSISKKVEASSFKSREVRKEEKKETYASSKEPYKYTNKVETKAKNFTPSPIISPIYGILDKNYKKEEVKENKEIRLTTRPSKVDFDSVRNKAFGDLEYDLFEDTKEDTKVVEPKDIILEQEKRERNKEKIEKIYKKEDDSKPSIERVTIGEADEYYNDLGLAYNTDYKDLSKEQKDGKVEETKDNNLEDNLFDLIESMYDKED